MNIQFLIILAIFFAAVFFIGRRFYLMAFRKKAGGCEKCGTSSILDEKPTPSI
jgi:hypothetical protein